MPRRIGECYHCYKRRQRNTAGTWLTAGLWLFGPKQLNDALTPCDCDYRARGRRKLRKMM